MAWVLLLLALLGHTMLWVALINRLHATALRPVIVHVITPLLLAVIAIIPLAVAGGWGAGDVAILAGSRWLQVSPAVAWYVGLCWLGGIAILVDWLRRQVLCRPPAVLRWRRSTRRTMVAAGSGHGGNGGHEHHFVARLPGNESLLIDVVELGLQLDRLPPALEGFRIAHLSDLHLSGAIGKGFFQEVVRLSNEFAPELTVITGDLVEKNRCIDWLPETLGCLQARYGVYFVLGNHDAYIDTRRLLQSLSDCGLIHLGGRHLQAAIRGETVILAGNELPWFKPAPTWRAAADGSSPRPALAIALAHSPDQFGWARSCGFDLLLSGHTHGGQVRLPGIGPIFAPSRVGVKYASGTFYLPPTVMHVSRGLSADMPWRTNCAPELGLLVLQAPTGRPSAQQASPA